MISAPSTLDIDMERYWMVTSPNNMSQQEVFDKIMVKLKLFVKEHKCNVTRITVTEQFNIAVKQSFSSNGYHITIYGCHKCPKMDLPPPDGIPPACRILFDDPHRVDWDYKFRPAELRNVFFDTKQRVDLKKWCGYEENMSEVEVND